MTANSNIPQSVEHDTQKRSQLQKWLEFTQRIYSSLELDQVLETILDLTLELTGMDRGFISLFEVDEQLEFRSGRNRRGERLTLQEFPEAASTIEKSLEMRRAFYFSEVPSLFGKDPQARSGFCAPLFSYRSDEHAKKIIGVLYEESNSMVDFGNLERETVNLIVFHAGPALEMAVLYDLATRDKLTRLYSRHYFDAAAAIEWKRTLRHRHSLSVLLIDVDDFRELNGTYGRERGDEILIETASILRDDCRVEDVICRYGGDEFAVLLPETSVPGARKVAKRILDDVIQDVKREHEPNITVSIGIAEYPRCAVAQIPDLLALAELALLRARQTGKNRIIVYNPSLSHAHKNL